MVTPWSTSVASGRSSRSPCCRRRCRGSGGAAGGVAARGPAVHGHLARRQAPAGRLRSSGDQVMVALDDVAALFQRDGSRGRARRRRDRRLQGQDDHPDRRPAARLGRRPAGLAAVAARPRRAGAGSSRSSSSAARSASIYDRKLDVRKNARFVLVGDVRVPHITVRADTLGPQTRVTFTVVRRARRTPSPRKPAASSSGSTPTRSTSSLPAGHAAGAAAGDPAGRSQHHRRHRRRPAVRLVPHVARAAGRRSAGAGGPDAGQRASRASATAARRRAALPVPPRSDGAAASSRPPAPAHDRDRPRARRRRDRGERRRRARSRRTSRWRSRGS